MYERLHTITMKEHILIIDDQSTNRLILSDLLAEFYHLHTAKGAEQALNCLLSSAKIDLILLDIVMPGIDGFELCQQIKAEPAWKNIPILFLTSLDDPQDEKHGLSLGAADFIRKPFSSAVVLARIETHLKLAKTQRDLELRNQDLERQIEIRTQQILAKSMEVIAVQSATITAFCALAETRDNETGNHIKRTQNYVRLLAEHLQTHVKFKAQFTPNIIDLYYRSAPLHDIGKVGIPDYVLLKPGKLTAEEWEIMQTHAELGMRAITQAESEFSKTIPNTFLTYAKEIAYCHHEYWDGSGYPQGLKGEEIPLSARLMAIADVYDALISKRVYKPAFSHNKAVEIIKNGSGQHFDPLIIEAFDVVHEQFREIALRYLDSDEQRDVLLAENWVMSQGLKSAP